MFCEFCKTVYINSTLYDIYYNYSANADLSFINLYFAAILKFLTLRHYVFYTSTVAYITLEKIQMVFGLITYSNMDDNVVQPFLTYCQVLATPLSIYSNVSSHTLLPKRTMQYL